MHFSLATIIAVVPLLAAASPLAEQPYSTISLSRKSDLRQEDGSIDVDKLSGHLASSVNKFKRGFDNYQRNTGKRHPLQPEVVSTVTKRDFGREELIEGFRNYWIGSIKVGTPPQDFWVEMDTGTSDLFIPHVSCDHTCDKHFRYNTSASSTAKELGKPFTIERYNSVASGNLYNDTVAIAFQFAVVNQTLGAATHYGEAFSDNNWGGPDGLMGLGFPSASVFNAPSLFQNLVNKGQAGGVFAVKLDYHSPVLTIGGLDPRSYSGTPTYTPITQDGFWQIEFSAFKVGDSVVAGPSQALVDTGTRFIVGSKAAVKAVYDRIKGSKEATNTIGPGFYTYPCTSRIPPLSFTFGDNELFMTPEKFAYGGGGHGSPTCIGSIAYDESLGESAWILGDSWMSNFYTIFDYDNKRVGFADTFLG